MFEGDTPTNFSIYSLTCTMNCILWKYLILKFMRFDMFLCAHCTSVNKRAYKV